MNQTISLETIRMVLPKIDTVGLMEEAFSAYSAGRAVVPPVGELIFDDPPGEPGLFMQAGRRSRTWLLGA